MAESEEKKDVNEEIEKESDSKENTILQEKQLELDELNDRYKRIMAEFENFKKRSFKVDFGTSTLTYSQVD